MLTMKIMIKFLLLCILLFGSINGQYTIRGVPESYAVLGENYRLQCDVTDSPSAVNFRGINLIVCYVLSSTCEGQPTDNRYKCGCINNNSNTLYLNISNITKQDDDTTWSCRGSNTSGQGSTTVPVYYGPENTRFNPTDDNIDVIEGKSQNVNCLADCNPDCTITWSKDGSTLNNPLSLSTRNQTGSYTCTVTHTVLNKQLTKQLNVQIYYGPDELTFSPDETSISIIEGGDQTITCLTDCYECSYKWTGPVSSSTKDLVLTQFNRTQEGNYVCEATNIKDASLKRTKSIQVNVHYPPEVTSLTSNAANNEADEGSDVIFNCNVDSKPVSTITWSSSTSTATNTGQQWTLTQAKCQDTGIYTCTANNGIGQSTSKSLPLNIRCLPRINGDLKDDVKNRLGEEVTLLIDVIAYPKPSFKWIQDSTGNELTPDQTQQVATNNFISSLTLTIQQSSFGNYTVTVTNGIGAENYTIKIIDGEPETDPEPPSDLNIPAVVGGIVAAVVVITIVIVAVIVIKKRRNSGPDSPTTSPKNQRLEIIPNDLYESSDVVRQRTAHDNPAVEILENDLYAGSDAIFGKSPDVVPKANKQENEGGIFAQSNNVVPKAEPVYGEVNKLKKPKANKKKEEPKKPPKPDKPPPVPGKIGEGNNNEGVYQNTGAVGKQKKNVEGLNYADVVFTNKTPTNKIQGKKEETIYVDIDPKKRGKPLPKEEDSD